MMMEPASEWARCSSGQVAVTGQSGDVVMFNVTHSRDSGSTGRHVSRSAGAASPGYNQTF